MVACASCNGLVSRLSLLCLVPVMAYFQLPLCRNDESLSISSLRNPQAVSHKPYSIVECLGQSWICASLWLAFPLGGRILSLFIWVAGHWRYREEISSDFLTVVSLMFYVPIRPPLRQPPLRLGYGSTTKDLERSARYMSDRA